MATISDLPDDLLKDILSRLQSKFIMRCRCVSKPWHTLLSTSSFIKLYFNRSNLRTPHLLLQCTSPPRFKTIDTHFLEDDEPLNLNLQLPSSILVTGCCNGIFCISNTTFSFMSLLNPSTKECIQLPWEPMNRRFGTKITFGFGCDRLMKEEYKIVVITSQNFKNEAKILTLGSNSWRRLEDVPSPSFYFHAPFGKYLNGSLHWITSPCIEHEMGISIKYFDLKTEKFGDLPWPEFDQRCGLVVLDGCIAMMRWFINGDYVEGVEVWTMKAYGVKESWVRLFSIQDSVLIYSGLDPLVIRKNGEILFFKTNGGGLLFYDPVADMDRVPDVRDTPGQFWADAYEETLTSLASLVAENRPDDN